MTPNIREVRVNPKMQFTTDDLCRMPFGKGVQYKQGNHWLLYQKYAEKGYTSTKTQTFPGADGQQHIKVHTYWTQKGRLFIYDLLKANGLLPLIEQDAV